MISISTTSPGSISLTVSGREAGVPVVGLKQNGWDYFDLHHTPDDTLDNNPPAAPQQKLAAHASFLSLAAVI